MQAHEFPAQIGFSSRRRKPEARAVNVHLGDFGDNIRTLRRHSRTQRADAETQYARRSNRAEMCAGRIVLVNAQTEKLFGYARQEMLGKSVELLVPEKLREQHRQHRRNYFLEPGVRPMGRGVNVTEMMFFRFVDGRMVEAWEDYDEYGMRQQLAPPTTGAALK